MAHASVTANYVSIRDDAGLRSLSRNERSFTRDCALRHTHPLRVDGRTAHQVRPVRLHLGRWDHGSECTVQWGNTRVTSLCTAELVRPTLDRPNEGQMVLSVDLSPSASSSFRQAPPFTTGGNSSGPNHASNSQRLQANRILRCLEKIVLTGGTLDVEALCLIPGQWVWRFHVALTVLDDGGNPMDAAVMAAIASLRHYRKPHVDLQGGPEQDSASSTTTTTAAPVLIPSHLKEPTPLPLHHTPLAISFAFIPLEDGHATTGGARSASASSTAGVVAAFMDPTDREELVQNASLTVAMNVHGEVCLLDYGGGCELPPTLLQECWKKAESCIRQLCEMLEKSLDDADQQAQKDRLQKLLVQQQQQQQQQQQEPFSMELPPLPSSTSGPFFQQSDGALGDVMKVDDDNDNNNEQIQTQAEEEYRQFALDYKQGFKTTKVREDDDRMKNSSQAYFNQAGKLMRSLVQSAKAASSSIPEDNTSPPAHVKDNQKQSSSVTKPAKTAAADPAKKPKPQVDSSGHLDSDEEETTQLLQSEFQSPPAAAAASTVKPIGDDDDDDDDIDDLAMAISSKKKKKKKKTRK